MQVHNSVWQGQEDRICSRQSSRGICFEESKYDGDFHNWKYHQHMYRRHHHRHHHCHHQNCHHNLHQTFLGENRISQLTDYESLSEKYGAKVNPLIAIFIWYLFRFDWEMMIMGITDHSHDGHSQGGWLRFRFPSNLPLGYGWNDQHSHETDGQSGDADACAD